MGKSIAACVAIACYNAEKSIIKAIQSALLQGSIVTSVLVVDDASTDQSRQVVESHFSKDSRVRIISLPENGGVAVARNALLEHAKEDFIIFLDSDDECLPYRVENQIALLLQAESELKTDLLFCVGQRELVKLNGTTEIVHCMGEHRPFPTGKLVANHILFGETADISIALGVTGTCTMAGRTSVFKRMGGFNPVLKRCEDIDIVVKLALAGGYIVGVDKPIIRQFRTEGDYKNHHKVLASYKLFLNQHRVYLKTISSYRFAFHYHAFMIAKHFRKLVPMFVNLLLAFTSRPDLTMKMVLDMDVFSKVTSKFKKLTGC